MQIKYIDKIYEDLCYKSIEHLEVEVTKYLSTKFDIQNPWILDSINGTRIPPKEKNAEVVFFGSYIQRFLESGNWPINTARFWVLSQSVKDVLVKLFYIDEDFINIIPRSELFKPKKKPKKSFPKISDDINFVYAGRISESKNIEALLYTVYHLQVNYQLKIHLTLIGNPDNMSHIFSMKEDVFSYEDRVDKIVNRLNWPIKPVFISEMGTEEWPKINIENPILISLSNFISEDFGVSAAQAIQAGWNCILSDWGGHKEFIGNNIMKVPNSFLFDNSGFTHLLEARTKFAAKHIHDQLIDRNFEDQPETIHQPIDKYIEIEQIDKLRRKFIHTNGGATSLYLLRGQMNKYKAQEVGEKFFSKLTEIVSGTKITSPEVVVITDDLSGTISDTKEFYLKILKLELEKHHTVEFVLLNKAMWKTNLLKIKTAKEIIIGFWTPKLIPYINLIREMKHKDCLIRINTTENINEFSNYSDISLVKK
jgi:glycosyltransferase involved in cell wall biosynthesis